MASRKKLSQLEMEKETLTLESFSENVTIEAVAPEDDGPHDDGNPPSKSPKAAKRHFVIGLGGTGINVIRNLAHILKDQIRRDLLFVQIAQERSTSLLQLIDGYEGAYNRLEHADEPCDSLMLHSDSGSIYELKLTQSGVVVMLDTDQLATLGGFAEWVELRCGVGGGVGAGITLQANLLARIILASTQRRKVAIQLGDTASFRLLSMILAELRVQSGMAQEPVRSGAESGKQVAISGKRNVITPRRAVEAGKKSALPVKELRLRVHDDPPLPKRLRKKYRAAISLRKSGQADVSLGSGSERRARSVQFGQVWSQRNKRRRNKRREDFYDSRVTQAAQLWSSHVVNDAALPV